jgi:DASS family divalent anion:Na+ symporter
VIIRQFDPGDAFYLVASGTVGVYTAKIGAEVRVKVLHAGEPFGEMALLTNSTRTATVRAESDCEVLRLERSSFLHLVREQPSVALSIAATLSGRLAGMLNPSSRPGSAQAVASPLTAGAKPLPAATAKKGRAGWRPGKGALALLSALVILALGLTLPGPSGLSIQAWRALIVLLAALPALILDTILEGVLALLIATGWVVLGAAAPAVALAGFASLSWILVISVLIVGASIASTGVLYRLALETITHMRGGFAGEVTALSLAGLLMGPAVPNATSRVIIIAPMLKEVVDALGYPPQSKGATGLAMAALIGFGQMTASFLTSSTTAVLVLALLPNAAQAQVSWLTWALYGAPFNLILFVGLVSSILWLYWPTSSGRRAGIERATSLGLQRALLGPMSRDEKIAIGVGIGLLAGFMTQPLHGLDPTWVSVLAAAVLAATGVANLNTLRAVNWNFALLFGILISLATVFTRTGLDRWMGERIAAASGDLLTSPLTFIVALVLLCFAITFVIRWQAAAPLVTIALVPVAVGAGVHPFIVALIAVVACNGFFVPYQSTPYLALYSGTAGKLFTNRQALPAALAYGVWVMVAAILSVPVWRLMGLL